MYIFQPTCDLSSTIRGYSIGGRIATCINGTLPLPPQPLFQADEALVANDQVIDHNQTINLIQEKRLSVRLSSVKLIAYYDKTISEVIKS